MKNFQNISNDHKSRNARAVHAISLFIISSIKSLRLYALGTFETLFETFFSGFQNALMFYLNRKYNCDRQTKPKLAFLVFQE